MLEKKRFYLVVSLIFVFVIFFIQNVSALGVSPAIVRLNFYPGLEQTITYRVSGISETKEMSLRVEGDLAKYVTLDRGTLIGPGGFSMIIKLPNQIDIPGTHRLSVFVAEKIDEELAGGAVGTSVTVVPAIDIFVPYPGKWLDINLEAQDVNINEPVNFILNIKSQGSDEITTTPRIEIYSETGNSLETIYFNERTIKSQEEIALTKALDTTSFNPGTYTAIAIVDYDGKTATSEKSFKIGELIINILNYTREIVINKIQAFDLGIESGWNDIIDGAYGEILISNSSSGQKMAEFKTSSTSLIPWESRIITGYFDTSNFTAGNYSANITLIYYGKEVGKSSSEIVEVRFVEKPDKLRLLKSIGVVFIVILILIFIWKYWRRKNAKRK